MFCDLRSERPDSSCLRRRRCTNQAYALARQRRLGTEDVELEAGQQDEHEATERRVIMWLQRQPFLEAEAKAEYDLSVLLTDELIAAGHLPPFKTDSSDGQDDLEFAAFGPMPACAALRFDSNSNQEQPEPNSDACV